MSYVLSSYNEFPPLKNPSNVHKPVIKQRLSCINLINCEYRDEAGEPCVFPVVTELERLMVNCGRSGGSDTEPFHSEFEQRAAAFLLGLNCEAIQDGRVVSLQTVGGTGGLRIAAEFSYRVLRTNNVYLPDTASAKEVEIFHCAGYSKVQHYCHTTGDTQGFTRRDMPKDLNAVKPGSTVLLRADGNYRNCILQDWKEIADICQRRHLFVVIYSSYQGLVSGDPDKDAQLVRKLVNYGLELMLVQSFSHNFGLYNERVGNLCVVTKKGCGGVSKNIRRHLMALSEELGLLPSYHGADVVSRILGDPQLYADWRVNLTVVTGRLNDIRHKFYTKLTTLQTPGSLDSILRQKGLFAHVHLKAHHIKYLKEENGIYAPADGCICLSGLNDRNLDYVTEAISYALKKVADDSKL